MSCGRHLEVLEFNATFQVDLVNQAVDETYRVHFRIFFSSILCGKRKICLVV